MARPSGLHRTAPIIAIFGAPAAGKTYWRIEIAEHLGWESIDIEDMGEVGSGRWTRMIDRLRTDDVPCVVESCASPRPYRVMLDACPSVVVHVVTPRRLRTRRLAEREPTGQRVRELLAVNGYPPRRPDLRIAPATPPATVAAAVDVVLARRGVGGRGL